MTATELAMRNEGVVGSVLHVREDVPGVDFTGTSWEDYEQSVEFAMGLRNRLPWIIGDLVVQGEAIFGERCYQAFPEWDRDYVNTCARVASMFPPSKRKAVLHFRHHEAVATAKLTPGEREQILRKAEKDGWTSEQIRHEKKALMTTTQDRADATDPRAGREKPKIPTDLRGKVRHYKARAEAAERQLNANPAPGPTQEPQEEPGAPANPGEGVYEGVPAERLQRLEAIEKVAIELWRTSKLDPNRTYRVKKDAMLKLGELVG